MQQKTAIFIRRLGVLPITILATALAACTVSGPQNDDGGSDTNNNENIDSGSSGQGGASSNQAGAGGSMAGTGGAGSMATGSTGSNTATSTGTSNGSVASSSSGMSGPVCGDGVCEAGENCQNCGDDCSKGGSLPATTGLDSEEKAFLVLINNYRAQNNLGALKDCKSLNRTAQGHSEDMRDQDYFAHKGLNGSEPWDRACDACYELGCGPSTAMAENIAAGNADAQKTFTQWKNSPGHDKNMKGANFKYIGIGRALGGGTYGSYWTNVFGGKHETSCD